MGASDGRAGARGFLFFAAAVLVGAAIVAGLMAARGRGAEMFGEDVAVTVIWAFAYLVVGVGSALASRKGAAAGAGAWVAGIVLAALVQSFCVWDERQALANHAWTGAALSLMCFSVLSTQAALIGCVIGGVVARRFAASPAGRAVEPGAAE